MAERLIEFKCSPIRQIYKADDFQIYAIDTDEKYKLKKGKFGQPVMLGNLHDLGIGVEYVVKALETKGRDGYFQYQVKNIQREKPTTTYATKVFLDEILTRDQTDEIMKHYPNIIDLVITNKMNEIDIKKLHNIGDARLAVIKRKIEENFVFAELIDTFQGLIDLKILKKLYEKYPSAKKIKESIQRDPYECLCSLSRVGFKTADSIILTLNRDLLKMDSPPFQFDFDIEHSPQRLNAAITYILRENEGNGNTKISIVDLTSQLKALVANCMNFTKEVLSNNKVYYLDKADKSVALMQTYKAEKHVVEMMLRGLKTPQDSWNVKNIDKYRKIDDEIELTSEQFDIMDTFISKNISILNGVSGSGKSMSTKAIINLLDDMGKNYTLLAPTGRASKVLSGYTGRPASTVHRALGYQGKWEHTESQPKLRVDVVIVDEMSMVDIDMFRALLCVIDFNRTKLLMIGDSEQIPSVGAGNILYDLMQTKKIPIVSLTKVFRYGTGGILTVATDTRECRTFIKSATDIQVIGEDKGYTYLPVVQEGMMRQVVRVYSRLLEKNKSEDILVLSAYNTGNYGTKIINNAIQKIANPNALTDVENVIKLKDVSYYEGDMVIQIVNNYKSFAYEEGKESYDEQKDGEVFISNGEIGKVVKIGRFYKNNQQYMVVDYDGAEILYKYDGVMNQLNLAYSISIHKSQGSGIKNVILITPKAHTFMLNANLMYVGMTRAIDKVYHLGDPATFNRAVKKKANFERQTFMQQLISNPLELDLKLRYYDHAKRDLDLLMGF